MFTKYKNLIEKLRQNDPHFARIFNEHGKLDEEIDRISRDTVSTRNTSNLSQLKVNKLRLKEQLYQLLQQASAQ